MNTMTATPIADIQMPEAPITETGQDLWQSVCKASDLLPDTGVCALVNQQQVAVFHVHRLQEFFAVSNFDPVGKANVLSRGMIGSLGESIVVASPLYKQHFDLRTGGCLEKPECKIRTYPVRVHQGVVQVFAP